MSSYINFKLNIIVWLLVIKLIKVPNTSFSVTILIYEDSLNSCKLLLQWIQYCVITLITVVCAVILNEDKLMIVLCFIVPIRRPLSHTFDSLIWFIYKLELIVEDIVVPTKKSYALLILYHSGPCSLIIWIPNISEDLLYLYPSSKCNPSSCQIAWR